MCVGYSNKYWCVTERGCVGERVSGVIVNFVTEVLNQFFSLSQIPSQWVSYVSVGLILRLSGSHITSQWVSYYVSIGLTLRLILGLILRFNKSHSTSQ